MIIEGLNFLFCAFVNPYPGLVSAGWSHTAIAIYMALLYIVYFLVFVVLLAMYREWKVKEVFTKDEQKRA